MLLPTEQYLVKCLCTMLSLTNTWNYLYWWVRPLIKWFLHRTTQLCELQRICYGLKSGSERIKGVEQSLTLSRSRNIKLLLTKLNDISASMLFHSSKQQLLIDEAVMIVMETKRIDPKIHKPFIKSLGKCLEQIWSYKQLYHEVELLRITQYDSDNHLHENKLYQLWSLLVPDTKLESRITKQWQHIGFQGDDPKTDFRGMGMLGLENLLYFAKEYNTISNQVLSHSLHPQFGYTFAIVGINLTSMAYRLLKDGSFKTHMYNISKSKPNLECFHELYSFLFYEFDRHWLESKPKSIMDFSFIQERFEKRVRSNLMEPDTILRINIPIKNI